MFLSVAEVSGSPAAPFVRSFPPPTSDQKRECVLVRDVGKEENGGGREGWTLAPLAGWFGSWLADIQTDQKAKRSGRGGGRGGGCMGSIKRDVSLSREKGGKRIERERGEEEKRKEERGFRGVGSNKKAIISASAATNFRQRRKLELSKQ